VQIPLQALSAVRLTHQPSLAVDNTVDKIMYQTTPSLRYTYTRKGVYYFSRWIPSDLRKYYQTDRIVQSLQTRSATKAKQAASIIASRLDEYWLDIRLRNGSPLFKDKLLTSPVMVTSSIMTISEAKNLYQEIKGSGRSKVFKQSNDRIVNYLVQCHGDKPLDQYAGTDAAMFREWLIQKGLNSSSVRRAFSIIKAIINFAISELGLEIRNVFSGVYLPEQTDKASRKPIKNDTLRVIQAKCIEIDDEMRWLTALISDTGMRLGEAVGLLIDDINLEAEIPHIVIQPHDHRSLKTSSSKRTVPLVGYSLWAAERINANKVNDFCFPRYNKTDISNTNSASAALNKWLKSISEDHVVVHGFRHGLRDRLRAVEAPIELIDQIGGWSLQSVGQGYGEGYDLEHCHRWLRKCV
jgi:integrase